MKFNLGVLFLLLNISVQSNAGVGSVDCSSTDDSNVSLTLCLDDEVRELDLLRMRVQSNVFARIDIKYGKKDPTQAKYLRTKMNSSVTIWDQYRISYCEMESISIKGDEQGDIIKQCLLSVTKSRIEDLRILQLSI